MNIESSTFNTQEPLMYQLAKLGFEFDQKLLRALKVSASKPDLYPEDTGFPDSYITLALYRLNSLLTRLVDLDDTRYNLFHEYKLAPPCSPEEVIPGRRLCRVLDKAITFLEESNKTIGSGHYLKAIVYLTLNEPPIPADGFKNMVLHNTFSAETLLWGLGFTAWTSLSQAPELKMILEAVEAREPIDDIQYQISLDEQGRLSFRPISILNIYSVEHQLVKPRTQLAFIKHFKDNFASVLPSEILELEDLINNPKTTENNIQSFFEEHKQFFRLFEYRDIYPHVYLTRENDGPLIPDFILVDPELQKAMVLDLKLPSAKIIVKKPNRYRFTSAVEEARAQLLEYQDWFENRENREKLMDKLGMEVYCPRLGVIIGTSREFRSFIERQKLASRYPDIEVVTYDDIIRHAKRRMLLIDRS